MKNNIKILTIMCLSTSLLAVDKRPAEEAPTPAARRLRRADNPVLMPVTPSQMDIVLRGLRAWHATRGAVSEADARQAERALQARIFEEAERQRVADQSVPSTGPSAEEIAELDRRFTEVSARSAALRRAETRTPQVDPQEELPGMQSARRLFFNNLNN